MLPSECPITPIIWTGTTLQLLDQRRLPQVETYLDYERAPEVAAAISQMVGRGAPAIGITAAYAVVLSASQLGATRQSVKDDMETPPASRPTAVNLSWAPPWV